MYGEYAVSRNGNKWRKLGEKPSKYRCFSKKIEEKRRKQIAQL
jgi:hypothetical protein